MRERSIIHVRLGSRYALIFEKFMYEILGLLAIRSKTSFRYVDDDDDDDDDELFLWYS